MTRLRDFVLLITSVIVLACEASADGRLAASATSTPIISPVPPVAVSPAPTQDAGKLVPWPKPVALSAEQLGSSRPVPPGYTIDQVFEVALDAPQPRELVVVSHTVRQIVTSGNPAAAAVPIKEDCTRDVMTACIFRIEILTADGKTGRRSAYVNDTSQENGGVAWAGPLEAMSFPLGDGREGLILKWHRCTGVGSGCGDIVSVLTMTADAVRAVHGGFKAGFQVQESSVTVDTPVWLGNDPLCCPAGRRSTSIGLAANGELSVLQDRLSAGDCTAGSYSSGYSLTEPGHVLLRCADSGATIYRTAPETTIEPAAVGGLGGLKDGDLLRVEFRMEPCPIGQARCSRPTATRIVRLDGQLPAPTATPAPSPQFVTIATATVREGPGPEHAEIGLLRSGQSVQVLRRNRDSTWLFIVFPPGSLLRGWVPASAILVPPLRLAELPVAF